jgi:hypothetical protein
VEALEGEDPQGFVGALHETSGTGAFRTAGGWFLQVGALRVACSDQLLVSLSDWESRSARVGGLRDFRPTNGEHVAAVGSVAVAPEGMFAYLPDADASRRWMIDQVLDKTRNWYLLDVSVVGD